MKMDGFKQIDWVAKIAETNIIDGETEGPRLNTFIWFFYSNSEDLRMTAPMNIEFLSIFAYIKDIPSPDTNAI